LATFGLATTSYFQSCEGSARAGVCAATGRAGNLSGEILALEKLVCQRGNGGLVIEEGRLARASRVVAKVGVLTP
jgi:hypothetical protein